MSGKSREAGKAFRWLKVNPYTFETLEEIRSSFERGLMILLRGAITKVHPGDYAYMVADAGEGRGEQHD